LEAVVEAGQHPGAYLIPSAAIRGSHPALAEEEIAFSCHLDHQLPGANDNASGCAAILEVARALAKLVAEERLPRPKRTLRFYWPPEIEGTIALLVSRPELAERTRAVVHMDMVGGDPAVTKAIFHITRGPRSLPSFVHDVAEAFGRFVNAQSHAHAGGADVRWPLVDPEGGREALQAVMAPFSMGSDHQVWAEGTFRVPSLYFNDWPDRYIHTHADQPRNIDATKLLRAAFLGAASAWYLADLGGEGLPALLRVLERHALERAAGALARAEELAGAGERRNLLRHQLDFERRILESIEPFSPLTPEQRATGMALLARLAGILGTDPHAAPPPSGAVYRRNPEIPGPMDGFGYSYLQDQVEQRGLELPALLAWEGLWGGGAEAAYEALNLVNGQRSSSEIRDAVAASYGPLPQELVESFLELLVRIGVILR
jgi:aminopeptidase YwaD